ncbi:MAG: polysaccharide deacetylase family protein [Verrucomicrobiales bacterium]
MSSLSSRLPALLCIVLFSLSLVLLTQLHGDAPEAKLPLPDKLVVLTFDDSAKTHFTIARPLLKKYGFSATFFITEGWDFTTNKKDYMTWEEIAQLHADGFEIGNHTRDHMGVTDDKIGQLPEQLQAIADRCRDHGIPAPVTFAWPGNQITEKAFPILREHGIRFARRGGVPEYPYDQGEGFAVAPGKDHPLLLPSAGDSRPDWTLGDLIKAAKKATPGHPAILQFHGVPDTAHLWVSTETRKFERYMNWLATNGYKVIALRDLGAYIDPNIAPENPMAIIETRKAALKEEADGKPQQTSVTHALHSFQRQTLTDTYYSEGINTGDINSDGHMDIVHGPFWFAGPEFTQKNIIYGALPQPREAYANSFFSWVHDFNADGAPDVFSVGFPGTAAHVYENPGDGGFDTPWPKHEVFDWVSNESPHFTNLVGDDRPELVCTRDGFFGYATVNWSLPFDRWTFHKISARVAAPRFGHGLGVGDVNGDSRQDLLMNTGWFEQPDSLAGDTEWKFHPVPFAPSGGAEMYAYDVDGDGDNDVISSLAAHSFGLSWFEQTAGSSGDRTFKEHLIMGDRPSQNRYGVVFSELHSVNLADVDGDGLKDIVTGKTYWSHHRQSIGWDDGAVVYWFKLVRGKDGIDWVPHMADGESGIGRQIIVADVNGDTIPDILAGGMKGAHVLTQERTQVDESTWQAAQQVPIEPTDFAEPVTGPPAPIDPGTNAVPDAIEGESLKPEVSAGTTAPQKMQGFAGGKWSGHSQLFWRGGKVGDTLTFELKSDMISDAVLETVFTRAPDYGIVSLSLDGKPLGEPLDLYHFSKVTTTGVLSYKLGAIDSGAHTLTIEITGTNPNAVQSRLVGLDYIRIRSLEKQ